MKKLKIMAYLSLAAVLLSGSLVGHAEESQENIEWTAVEEIKEARLNETTERTVIYVDSLGNYVFHNVPQTNVSTMSQEPVFIDETKEVRESLMSQPLEYGVAAASSYTYDIEENPVHIGTWNNVKAYARHTLGTKTTSNGKKYLTTTGDATWYNRSMNVALPYRNGNATVAEHENQVDVAKQTSFTVTNPDNNTSVSVTVNDFGPQQNTDLGKKTIVDLDATSFTTLFGNTSVGRHVCTTYVEVQQYFN